MHGWAGIDEFVAVAANESFSEGARALGFSTTHMSRAVARLESRLQTALFNRTTRTVQLTEAGRIFFDHCRRIVADREEAIAQISRQTEPQGELRVTSLTTLGERFIVPIIHKFLARHPKLSATIDLTNRPVDLLSEGYDIGIRTGDLPDSGLIATRIGSRILHTCAAPSYLASYGRPRSIADLAQHECLVGSSLVWQFKTGNRIEYFRPNGRLQCNSGRSIAEAAIMGMGICQLPDIYVAPFLNSGELELLLPGFSIAAEPIWALYSQRRHLLPKISGLLELLQAELPAALQASR